MLLCKKQKNMMTYPTKPTHTAKNKQKQTKTTKNKQPVFLLLDQKNWKKIEIKFVDNNQTSSKAASMALLKGGP